MIEQPTIQTLEATINKPFFVYLPGLTGGGRGLSALRQVERLYAPSSLSTPEAAKKGEHSPKDHHRNLAFDILKRSGGRDVVFFTHSMGGFEAIDVVSSMLDQEGFKDRKINLVFIATPGFTDKGLRGIVEFVKRFLDLNLNVTMYEQHIAYPLPENMYTTKETESDETGITVVFRDNKTKREERRQLFLKGLENSIPDSVKRQMIVNELQNIDGELTKSVDAEKIKELIKKRIRILHPLIQNMFKGKHLDEDTHRKFLEMYQELPENLSNSLTFIRNALLYVARMTGIMYHGMQKPLFHLLEKAKTKGVDMKFGFALLGKDTIIRKEDLPVIQKSVETNELAAALDDVYFLEQLSHSSLGYRPEPLTDFVKLLANRANLEVSI